MRLSVDRILVRGADERVDPRALRAAIERELARVFKPAPSGDREAIASMVGDAVRLAVKGDGR